MYQSEIERDEKEYLTAGQQSEEINYNYGGQTVNSPYAQSFGQPQSHAHVQPQHPLYPQPQPQAQTAQQDYFSGGAGINTNISANSNAFQGNAFDNVDISRGSGRLSGSTPFGTVHEFVSVSNKVKNSFYFKYYLKRPLRNSKISWILLHHTRDRVGSFSASLSSFSSFVWPCTKAFMS